MEKWKWREANVTSLERAGQRSEAKHVENVLNLLVAVGAT